mmetsp:Transcript_9421/g.16705  ORF Transcript_9421/g.16705 Transcript_9421/m.16705 type:complete len:214 (-) Transcript_9421:520-1161(-)
MSSKDRASTVRVGVSASNSIGRIKAFASVDKVTSFPISKTLPSLRKKVSFSASLSQRASLSKNIQSAPSLLFAVLKLTMPVSPVERLMFGMCKIIRARSCNWLAGRMLKEMIVGLLETGGSKETRKNCHCKPGSRNGVLFTGSLYTEIMPSREVGPIIVKSGLSWIDSSGNLTQQITTSVSTFVSKIPPTLTCSRRIPVVVSHPAGLAKRGLK